MNGMGDPFGPEALVLPLRAIGCRHAQTGEQRLMMAVLCDAMHAYAAEQVRRNRAARLLELRQWFESTDRSYVFSFESVCDALGLDAAYVRGRVLGRPPAIRRPWAHRVHSHRIVPPRVRHPARTNDTDQLRRVTPHRDHPPDAFGARDSA